MFFHVELGTEFYLSCSTYSFLTNPYALLKGPVFNKESQILLQDLFLVKYIHTMHEFFRKCQITAAAYRGGINMPTVYHSDDELEKLIKKFTADYLSQQLLGLFSYTFATTIGLFLQHIGFNIIGRYRFFHCILKVFFLHLDSHADFIA